MNYVKNHYRQESSLNPVPKTPLVPGLPLLGNALELKNDFVGFLVKNYQQYGPIFRVQVPNQNFTVLAGPEANNFMSQLIATANPAMNITNLVLMLLLT